MKATRILCGILAAIMMLGLVGCAGSSTAESPSVPYEPPETQNTEATTEPPVETGEPETEPEETEEPTPEIEVGFHTFTYQYMDDQYYVYEATITISPWILESNTEVLEAAWAKVGKNHALPSINNMGLTRYSDNLYMTETQNVSSIINDHFRATMTDMYFSVGTVTIKNITEGWSFSESNPGGSKMVFWWNSPDTKQAYHNYYSMLGKVFYSSKEQYSAGYLYMNPSMKSDSWGPATFVLAHAENITPKYPEGEYLPELRTGYLLGRDYIDYSTHTQNHLEIHIPIYGEEWPVPEEATH